MKQFIKEQIFIKGFSLIEIMVVVAIFTIIIGAAYALLNSGRTGWYSGDTKIELQEDLRELADAITYELSQSAISRIAIGGGGASITFQVPVDDVGDNPPGIKMEDTNGDGKPDFYLADTLFFDMLNNDYRIRWGAYLRGENKTLAGARTGRQVRFIRVGDELRRHVLTGSNVMENFRLGDDIQNINFSIDATSSGDVVIITITGNKLTIDRHPVNYTLTTSVHLRNRE
jgi:prepilin-type N-terminal cleavage/methylation domain-containing protein